MKDIYVKRKMCTARNWYIQTVKTSTLLFAFYYQQKLFSLGDIKILKLLGYKIKTKAEEL